MTVGACVADLLCTLGDAGVGVVKAVLTAQIAAVEAQLAIVRAQILQYDIALIPIVATQAVAEAALGQIEGYAALVPPALITDCVELGDMNVSLAAVVEPITDEVRAVLEKARRILSFKDELEDLEAFLEGTITAFSDIILAIELCP